MTTVGQVTAGGTQARGPSKIFIDEGERFAVIGDALMGADLRGLPAGYLTLPPEVYSDDLNAADRNIEKLETYVEFPGKP